MTDTVDIRRASAEDIHAIADLWGEMMDFHGERDAHFTRAENGREVFAQFAERQMAEPSACLLVATVGSAVVGYCLAALSQRPPVFADRRFGSIFDLAVTQRCRHQGIGERLVRKVEEWFTQNNVRRVEVRVAAANEVSMPFWRKVGYSPYLISAYRDIYKPENPPERVSVPVGNRML